MNELVTSKTVFGFHRCALFLYCNQVDESLEDPCSLVLIPSHPAWFSAFVHVPDVDECKEKVNCQCAQCKCKNTWGSYECSCGGGLLYMREHDACISEYSQFFSVSVV